MSFPPRFSLPLLSLFLFAAAAPGFSAGPSLTAAEKSAGWRLLFDGHSLAGWRLYGGTTKPAPIGPGWKAEDGILKKLAGTKGGAIITEATFDDFELSWEWRLAKGANNGVKYFVTEKRPQAPGFEYQTIDNTDPKWSSLLAKSLTASF